MFQRWRNLLFLHWLADPDQLQARLPSKLTLDLFAGQAYLGIVPFFMERVRPRFLPPVPGLSNFLELNVRTYVRDPDGRPGVWFFSLDCDQSIAVTIAQKLFNLPYRHAQMSAHTDSKGLVHYQCRRRHEERVSRWQYRIPPTGQLRTAAEGSLEFFLLERYLLFSQDRQERLHWGQVQHPPYRFSEADVPRFDDLPFQWNHLHISGDPVSALASPGPEVSIHPLHQL